AGGRILRDWHQRRVLRVHEIPRSHEKVSQMIANLWHYFGIVGCLSLLTWLATLALLGIYCRSPKRTRLWLYALAAACVGLGLAKLNSRSINAIQVDRTVDQETAVQRMHELQAESGGRAHLVDYAEDSPEDKLDLAGRKSEDDASQPEYRKQGKQQR